MTRNMSISMAWWNSHILIVHPQSATVYPQFWIIHPLTSNSLSSTLLPASSVKSEGYLTQNVLKIAKYPPKCLKVPLAALSRSGIFLHEVEKKYGKPHKNCVVFVVICSGGKNIFLSARRASKTNIFCHFLQGLTRV